jgi:hypothetical protein
LPPTEGLPAPILNGEFFALIRTPEGFSLIVPEALASAQWQVSSGWRCLRIQGPVHNKQNEGLAEFTNVLGPMRVNILVVSSYDSDYLLVKAGDLELARRSFAAQGHVVIDGELKP